MRGDVLVVIVDIDEGPNKAWDRITSCANWYHPLDTQTAQYRLVHELWFVQWPFCSCEYSLWVFTFALGTTSTPFMMTHTWDYWSPPLNSVASCYLCSNSSSDNCRIDCNSFVCFPLVAVTGVLSHYLQGHYRSTLEFILSICELDILSDLCLDMVWNNTLFFCLDRQSASLDRGWVMRTLES